MSSTEQDDLREGAACGDQKKVGELLAANKDLVNSQHSINGWTALHWAAKRNHLPIVHLLLENGADKNITTTAGESAVDLTTSADIRRALGGSDEVRQTVDNVQVGFTPSYLQHPHMPSYYNKTSTNLDKAAISIDKNAPSHLNSTLTAGSAGELVLKVRRTDAIDGDFIEVELDNSDRTFHSLLELACRELCVNPSNVKKVRKLPNTVLRKDKDIARLTDFQEIELVIKESSTPGGLSSTGRSSVIGTSRFLSFTGDDSVLY